MRCAPEGRGQPLAALEEAWDCHVHLFGGPTAPDARYRPAAPVSLDALRAHLAGLGARRCVIVQPSVYGDDNSLMLEALAAMQGAASGVIVSGAESLDDRSFARLNTLGVRAVRINPAGRISDFATIARRFHALADRLSGTGWHLELHAPAALAPALLHALGARPLRLVFDHAFSLDPAAPAFQRDLEAVLDVAADGRVWAKLSGLERVAAGPEARQKLDAALARLIERMRDRLVWGSDWPHTPLRGSGVREGLRPVDAAAQAAAVLRSAGQRCDAVFTRNPAVLYGR